jgi:hypothetical protein
MHLWYFLSLVGWVRSVEIKSRHAADMVQVVVLTSSLNPGGTCIADGGVSSELDRDRGHEVAVVSSLMSCLELISNCATGEQEPTMRTLSRLWGRLG